MFSNKYQLNAPRDAGGRRTTLCPVTTRVNDDKWIDLPNMCIKKRKLWEKDLQVMRDYFVAIHQFDDLRPEMDDFRIDKHWLAGGQ